MVILWRCAYKLARKWKIAGSDINPAAGAKLFECNNARELLDAKWEHFDLEHRSWRTPTSKTGKARHVPLSAAMLSVLSQLPRWPGCSYVVPNPKTKLPYVSIFCSWNTARKQAGLPEVRMHDLRHGMASNMVNSGRSILEVSKVLGHTQLKTSQRYSHLSNETLLAAVDASANAIGTDWGPAQTVKAVRIWLWWRRKKLLCHPVQWVVTVGLGGSLA
jgi:integrase